VSRRRIILYSIVAVVAIFAGYQYFFAWRISTRTPQLATGVPGPDFSLADQNGRAVTLASLTQHGPAVLVFYRGHW
jgi:hypothetical protein